MTQLVQVKFDGGNRAYTYRWEGDAHKFLGPKDRVVVPANWANKEPQFATVTAVGSDYKGPTSELLAYVHPHTHGLVGKDGRPVRTEGDEGEF